MSQNLKRELKELRHHLMACLCTTIPTKEFRAAITMAMIGLHITEAQIRKTQNLEERRRLINEFNKRKNAIQKGLRALMRSNKGDSENSNERPRRAVH
jgi:hypothetical protein